MCLKSSIIVLSLFTSSVFANSTPVMNYPYNSQVINGIVYSGTGWQDYGWGNCSQPSFSYDGNGNIILMRIRAYDAPYGNCYFDGNLLYATSTPPAVCNSGFDLNTSNNLCVPHVISLSDYDGDRVACMEHGGWTINGKCVTEAAFKSEIKQIKTGHVVGTGLKIGGALLTAAGLIGLPFTFGASAGLIAAGVHSYVGGALYLGVNNTASFSDNAGSMGSALSTGGKTYKLSLQNYVPSGSTTPQAGQVVSTVDEWRKSVSEMTFIPQSVKTQMADASKVDFVNDTRSEPIDMTGTIKSTYNYDNKTVTTQTQISPTEIKTEISPISVTQNFDGSITATPPPSSSAPTVSGSNGGDWTDTEFLNKIEANYDATTAYHEGLVNDIINGTNNTPDINVTKVTDQAQHNSDIISKLDEIKSALTSGSVPALSDGTSNFSSLDTQVKGAYTGFIYTDPLGLNALGGGSIPSYGFTLYGRHFVLMDQAMFDNLPLDAIRNLFLFVAAIAAFITVISGV